MAFDVIQLCRNAGNDLKADLGGAPLEDSMAYEVAGCLLDDADILKAAKAKWPGKSRQILQEIMADYI
jgi:hypothetical protein